MHKAILVVEDQPSQLRLAESVLNCKMSYLTTSFNRSEFNLNSALYDISIQPDVAIIDMTGTGQCYIDTVRAVKSYKPQLPIIALTQYGNEELAVQAVMAGASDYIIKPVGLERLGLTIKNVLKTQNMSKAIARLERHTSCNVTFSDIIGATGSLNGAVVQAQVAASSRSPIWIEGEYGTGKEMFARAIHGSGESIGQPFLVIDCARFVDEPDMLLQHMKKVGNGTLYLKEVNMLPHVLHQNFLDFLEMKIANASSGNTGFRVIIGSSKPIGNLVAEGIFDVILRKLHGMIISLPSLRERKQDIGELAKHFVDVYSAVENKFIAGITDDGLKLLESSPWPGNLTHLVATIQRAVLMCNQNELDAATIRLVQQLEPVNYTSLGAQFATGAPTLLDVRGRIKKLKSIEEEAIRFALVNSGGSMSRAARNLGIGRSTLYRKVNGMAPDVHISLENQTMRPMMTVSAANRS